MTRPILVTFADGAFKARKPQFLREVEAMDVFSDVMFFDFDTLPADFRKAHGAYMKATPKGFGYYIWKPQVTLQALLRAKAGELVVFIDAGYTLNPSGRARMIEYFEIAQDHPFRMLSFLNVHTEHTWTKADLAVRLGAGPAMMNTSQLGGGLMVIGKTPENVDLAREWQEVTVADNYHFSDDSPSIAPNHPSFREHRYDQSISGLLRKMRGTAITHYEVHTYDQHFNRLRPTLPAWATRSKT